ncbi:metal-sensing transcriptional repressor [Schaalia turicensis]|uniref:metal-sensing transcriptional repressor n=1 Tax=Schaalia turicensis TaxID=131111 RepID=UPI0018987877
MTSPSVSKPPTSTFSIRTAEGGQDCKAVVTQLATTNSAIQRAGFTSISAAMRECVSDDE